MGINMSSRSLVSLVKLSESFTMTNPFSSFLLPEDWDISREGTPFTPWSASQIFWNNVVLNDDMALLLYKILCESWKTDEIYIIRMILWSKDTLDRQWHERYCTGVDTHPLSSKCTVLFGFASSPSCWVSDNIFCFQSWIYHSYFFVSPSFWTVWSAVVY